MPEKSQNSRAGASSPTGSNEVKRKSDDGVVLEGGSAEKLSCSHPSTMDGNVAGGYASLIPRTRPNCCTESCSLAEMQASFRTTSEARRAVVNGQFLSLLLYSCEGDEQRKLKKQILNEAFSALIDESVQVPKIAQDALIAMYESPEDLQLLALANIVISGGLLLPKELSLQVVQLMEWVESAGASCSDEYQLFACSLMMCRAITVLSSELTALLMHSCSRVVRDKNCHLENAGNVGVNSDCSRARPKQLRLAALLCLRSYLKNSLIPGAATCQTEDPNDGIAKKSPAGLKDGESEVASGNNTVSSGRTIPSGLTLAKEFCQKLYKHRPAPMNRECVSLLKAISLPLYSSTVRKLFSGEATQSTVDNCNVNFATKNDMSRHPMFEVLRSTAIKLPTEVLGVFARVYCLSPPDSIPIVLISSIVETLISSHGVDVIVDVIRFTLTCSETSFLLKAFFEKGEDEVVSEQSLKIGPLLCLYRTLKEANDSRIVWPAVALRFLAHNIIDTDLANGSIQRYIDSLLQRKWHHYQQQDIHGVFFSGDDARGAQVAAMLLLCPSLPLRITNADKPLAAAFSSKMLPKGITSGVGSDDLRAAGNWCTNCAVMDARTASLAAGQDVLLAQLESLLMRVKHSETLAAQAEERVTLSTDQLQARCREVAVLQSEISVNKRRIEELRQSGESCQKELTEQRAKYEGSMDALRLTKKDLEKCRLDHEIKKTECQNLQRELSITKELLSEARIKIDNLESFKEKLSSFVGSFGPK